MSTFLDRSYGAAQVPENDNSSSDQQGDMDVDPSIQQSYQDSESNTHSPAEDGQTTGGPAKTILSPLKDENRVIRHRNRTPVNCDLCRKRKLKCNRARPSCDNCVRRGEQKLCTYSTPTSRRRGTTGTNHANSPNSGGEAREEQIMKSLARLEGMFALLDKRGVPFESVVERVQQENAQNAYRDANSGAELQTSSTRSESIDDGSSVMRSNASNLGLIDSPITDMENDAESETDGVTKSVGVMKIDHERNKTFYVGDGYWAGFLNDISTVKNYFADPARKREIEAHMTKISESKKAIQDASAGLNEGVGGFVTLFGATTPAPLNEILARVPPRHVCDILMERYQYSMGSSTHILHGPTIRRQYERFWNEMDLRRAVIGTTAGTSVCWLGMLFAMMRLACLSYSTLPDQLPDVLKGRGPQLSSSFRQSVCDCLIREDFTKSCNLYVVETLIFHLYAEYTSSKDMDFNVGHLSTLLVRIAMRMGYHRDSKFFPDLTPYQGEMRRRVWTYVRTTDILFSQQIILPPTIRFGDSDTELPGNLNDTDFDEDSRALPPSRPRTEATDSTYLIYMGKLAYMMSHVTEELLESKRKTSYDQILAVDRKFRETYDEIPSPLKVASFSEPLIENSQILNQKNSLVSLYHKALCVLHRKYAAAKPFNRYPYSRKVILESSLLLLENQAANCRPFAPGPQDRDPEMLRKISYHVSGLQNANFLWAGTLLCLDLYAHREHMTKSAQSHRSSIGNVQSKSSSQTSPASTNLLSPQVSSDKMDRSYCPGLPHDREVIIRAVERSRNIWEIAMPQSIDAYKARTLFNAMLKDLRSDDISGVSGMTSTPDNQVNSLGYMKQTIGMPSSVSNGASRAQDEASAAMTLGLLQSGNNSQQQGGTNQNVSILSSSNPTPAPVNAMRQAQSRAHQHPSPKSVWGYDTQTLWARSGMLPYSPTDISFDNTPNFSTFSAVDSNASTNTNTNTSTNNTFSNSSANIFDPVNMSAMMQNENNTSTNTNNNSSVPQSSYRYPSIDTNNLNIFGAGNNDVSNNQLPFSLGGPSAMTMQDMFTFNNGPNPNGDVNFSWDAFNQTMMGGMEFDEPVLDPAAGLFDMSTGFGDANLGSADERGSGVGSGNGGGADYFGGRHERNG